LTFIYRRAYVGYVGCAFLPTDLAIPLGESPVRFLPQERDGGDTF